MADDGSIPTKTAVDVLRAHGIGVCIRQATDDSDEQTLMVKDLVVDAQTFPLAVNRRMVHRIARKFDIPIHYFYHPELTPQTLQH